MPVSLVEIWMNTADSCANPVQAKRESYGLSRRQFSAVLGCSFHDLWGVETGLNNRIPPRVLNALVKLGIDAEELATEYNRWISDRAEQAHAAAIAGESSRDAAK